MIPNSPNPLSDYEPNLAQTWTTPLFAPAQPVPAQPVPAQPVPAEAVPAEAVPAEAVPAEATEPNLATIADVTSERVTWLPPAVQRPSRTRVWGTEFAQVDMRQAIQLADAIVRQGKPEYFVTANLNYLMLTEHHPRLSEVNQRSAAVIADGQPIVWRSRLTANPLPGRVAGADLIVELARLAAERAYRIFFLGAAPGVAQAAALELNQRFPTLQIAGCFSPPFRTLSAAEHLDMLARIRSAKPDILLVAFGQPKGEFWIYDNLHELNVPLSIQLGASFDFLAGTATRAPRSWQYIGCEWLYRALSDPLRLGPRYAGNILFLAKQMIADLSRAV